ncbi:MAG: hypothetical protein RR505_12165 [Raoultibacter sp.]
MTPEHLAAQTAAMEQIRKAMKITISATVITDEQAMQVNTLFHGWNETEAYKAGDIRRFSGELYRCLSAHTAQAAWTPDVSSSLWKRIGDPDESGIYPWSQPVGAVDAYVKGEEVTHRGKTWTSDVDGNVWEPGVYGWTEVKGK